MITDNISFSLDSGHVGRSELPPKEILLIPDTKTVSEADEINDLI